MFHVAELLWDEWNLDHIAEHDVLPEEVEQVCNSNPFVRKARNETLAVYGQSDEGRYLMVFLGKRGKHVYYPITARDMTDRERRTFQKARKR